MSKVEKSNTYLSYREQIDEISRLKKTIKDGKVVYECYHSSWFFEIYYETKQSFFRCNKSNVSTFFEYVKNDCIYIIDNAELIERKAIKSLGTVDLIFAKFNDDVNVLVSNEIETIILEFKFMGYKDLNEIHEDFMSSKYDRYLDCYCNRARVRGVYYDV